MGANEQGKGVYQGLWKNNKRHGFGMLKWSSGRIYIGNWV
jgi:hypothetical protein